VQPSSSSRPASSYDTSIVSILAGGSAGAGAVAGLCTSAGSLAFLADEVELRRRARNWSPLLLEVDRMISSIALLLWKLWPRLQAAHLLLKAP